MGGAVLTLQQLLLLFLVLFHKHHLPLLSLQLLE
jgi:hypothetical protein